jgi:hypothetical protein
MKITDLNGFEIEVTNLNKAIKHAKNFKNLHHTPPLPSDKERQDYWKDLYEKLLIVKSKSNHEQSRR